MSSPFSILGPATKTTTQRWFFVLYPFAFHFLSCMGSGHRRFNPSCPISAIGRYSYLASLERLFRPCVSLRVARPLRPQCGCSTFPLRSVSSARFVYCVQIGFGHFHRKISIYLHISKIFCNFAAQNQTAGLDSITDKARTY